MVNLVDLFERGRQTFKDVHAEGRRRSPVRPRPPTSAISSRSRRSAPHPGRSRLRPLQGRGGNGGPQQLSRGVILRPSIVFGPEDDFFNRFAAMARLSPVLPLVGGETRFQPVFVGNVADAVIGALRIRPAAARSTNSAGLRYTASRN